MTNETDTPERIEREIEQDRDALSRTLNDLQDELSLDGFARRLTDKFRENGSEWANTASDAARSNPVALALTGVGLAWLIFGRGYDPTHRVVDHRSRRRSSEWDRTSEPYRVSPTGTDADGTGNIGIQPVPSSGRGGWSSTGTSHGSDGGSGGSSKLGSMTEGLRQKAHDWKDRISDSTSSLHDRLSEGTEGFSEEARRRVYDARRRAVDAQDSAARRLRESSRTVSKGYDSEPLFFGAAAAAIGAGLACLLPRTRQEDELLGSYSDQLFHEAESIFEEEKAKVQNAVSAGLEEAKSVAAQVTAAAKKELTEGDSGNTGPGSGAEPSSRAGSQSDRFGSTS